MSKAIDQKTFTGRDMIKKRHSSMSGLIGGSIVSILGVLFLRQGMYILNAISQIIRGLSVPSYKPFYTLEQAGAYFLVAGLTFCLVTNVLWIIVGTGYGTLINKQEWSKKRIFYTCLLWGMSVPLVFIPFLLLLVFWENGNLDILEDSSFLTYLAKLFIWWSISGLVGGSVSALYLTRHYESNKR